MLETLEDVIIEISRFQRVEAIVSWRELPTFISRPTSLTSRPGQGKQKTMHKGSIVKPLVIALDGGTTNTRARLVSNDEIIGEAKRAVGVRDTVLSEKDSPLANAVRECLAEIERHWPEAKEARIIASGMLSSEVGLWAVPHALAPAGIEELARAARSATLKDVSDKPILFIPGVRTPAADGPDGWLLADLMRGEECETLGVINGLQPHQAAAFLWPGSHTKLVEVDEMGRICRSTTTLAGEITATLASQTMIAKSLPRELPDQPDASSVAKGIEVGASEGLGRAAFLVRIADVSGQLNINERAAFWIGAVIGNDIAHLAKHPILMSGVPVWVGGREPQKTIYAQALQSVTGRSVNVIEAGLVQKAAAIGATNVARRAGWLD
jgi:2-dehydro-3-deoxygalactonokinase